MPNLFQDLMDSIERKVVVILSSKQNHLRVLNESSTYCHSLPERIRIYNHDQPGERLPHL